MSIHTQGRINQNWPLCTEVAALGRGWLDLEIEDGELVDDPLITGSPADAPWFVDRPATCRECVELVHA